MSQMQDSPEHEPSGTGDNEVFTIDWKFKERAAKELVGSIQRRFQHENKAPRAKNKVIRKSNSFDEKLAKLVPEFESLPLKTRQDCSLDRYRMKQCLPFEQLAAMCPPMTSVGDKFPDALSAAISRSCDGRKIGYRKMSAPVVSTDLFSFRRPDSNSAEKDRDEVEDEEVNTTLGTVGDDGMNVFDDNQEGAQNQFRARSRAIRLRDGERRNRRLTEPILYSQSRTEHM